jgi:hypothetical protein
MLAGQIGNLSYGSGRLTLSLLALHDFANYFREDLMKKTGLLAPGN